MPIAIPAQEGEIQEPRRNFSGIVVARPIFSGTNFQSFFKASTLFFGISQFRKAICYFQPADIKLKAFAEGGIAFF